MKLKLIIFTTFAVLGSGLSLGNETCFVDLGTTERMLSTCLDNPVQVQNFPASDEFGMSETKRITLTSATLDLHLRNGEYYVWRIEITGKGWVFNRKGLAVGLPQEGLTKLIGKAESISGYGKDATYFYRLHDFDSWVKIEVREGLVARIFAAEDWT